MNLNDLIAFIEERMEALFPDNTADTPVSWAKEREPDGSYTYAAYIEVRTRSDEFDVRGQSRTNPQVALARAFQRLRADITLG